MFNKVFISIAINSLYTSENYLFIQFSEQQNIHVYI